jgi:alcohol dehydrogenase class IV
VTFEFVTAPHVRFGPGVASEVGTLTAPLGRAALLVTGRTPGRAASIADGLRGCGVAVTPFHVVAEPEIRVVQQGASLARTARVEVIVGVGGGSVIDAAKAIAALATNVGDPFDYLEVVGRGQPLGSRPLPIVAVPTTAGTGSEVTKNAVLTSPVHRVKVSLRSPFMLPRVAVVDPALTFDLPPQLTASTGLDALTQLIEPYVSSRANPMTDALCLEALPRAAACLRRAYEDGHDAHARTEMAFASLCGGMALANAGLGAVHGFAGTLGGLLGAPHGALCAALLPHVLAGNLRAIGARAPDHPIRARFEALGPLLTGRATAGSSEAIRWIEALVSACAIPPLSTYGLTAADTAHVVEQAAQSSSMKGNPIALGRRELELILQAAM